MTRRDDPQGDGDQGEQDPRSREGTPPPPRSSLSREGTPPSPPAGAEHADPGPPPPLDTQDPPATTSLPRGS